MRGRGAAGARDHGQAAAEALHRDLQQLRRFGRAERCRLAGRPADDDAIAALARVPVEQAPERDVIDVAGLRHRRHERNETAAKHVTPRPIGRHWRRMVRARATRAQGARGARYHRHADPGTLPESPRFSRMKQFIAISAIGDDRIGLVHDFRRSSRTAAAASARAA